VSRQLSSAILSSRRANEGSCKRRSYEVGQAHRAIIQSSRQHLHHELRQGCNEQVVSPAYNISWQTLTLEECSLVESSFISLISNPCSFSSKYNIQHAEHYPQDMLVTKSRSTSCTYHRNEYPFLLLSNGASHFWQCRWQAATTSNLMLPMITRHIHIMGHDTYYARIANHPSTFEWSLVFHPIGGSKLELLFRIHCTVTSMVLEGIVSLARNVGRKAITVRAR
jgi:hypothetical protein